MYRFLVIFSRQCECLAVEVSKTPVMMLIVVFIDVTRFALLRCPQDEKYC